MNRSYRPGVYSEYDVISRRRVMEDRYAFYCGAAKVKEGKNLPAGGVVQLKSPSQLEEFFEPQGAGKEFFMACRMLLNAGVSGVYAVPLTVDGSQAGEPLYEGALRKLCEVKRGGVILCDSTKPEVLQKLKEQVELASQNERERLAVGCVAKEQAMQTAKALNCERLVLCCQKAGAGAEEMSLGVCAAAVASMLAVGEAMDSYHSHPLEGVEQLEQLSEQEIETMLGGGVTVLEMADGQAECIRCVTTRTFTGTEEDRTFSSVNVVMMIDEIIRAVRERLSEMLKGKRVGFSQDSVVSQAAVVLDEKKQEGLITSFEPPVAYVQKEDPSVCVVELEFDLAAVFSRIYLTAHISI